MTPSLPHVTPSLPKRQNPRWPQGDEYGPHNPRRSQRLANQRQNLRHSDNVMAEGGGVL